MIERNQYYLTINEILVTWSLKIHFILNEVLFKHTSKLTNLITRHKSLFTTSPTTHKPTNFDLKILIESSMLVNFMLDYSQDASKVEKPLNTTPQVSYFNSHFSLVETVSIILNDVCLAYSSGPRWLDVQIDEVSMLANMDDQSLSDALASNEDAAVNLTTDNSLKRRKFYVARRMRLVLDKASERLAPERRLIGTQVGQNKLAEIGFDSIVVNYLFQYDFAKLLDHFLNLRKCLYVMHGYTKQRSVELSYDFLMNVKQLKLCVEDDPFEVR